MQYRAIACRAQKGGKSGETEGSTVALASGAYEWVTIATALAKGQEPMGWPLIFTPAAPFLIRTPPSLPPSFTKGETEAALPDPTLCKGEF